jgi:hypothetical protein
MKIWINKYLLEASLARAFTDQQERWGVTRVVVAVREGVLIECPKEWADQQGLIIVADLVDDGRWGDTPFDDYADGHEFARMAMVCFGDEMIEDTIAAQAINVECLQDIELMEEGS